MTPPADPEEARYVEGCRFVLEDGTVVQERSLIIDGSAPLQYFEHHIPDSVSAELTPPPYPGGPIFRSQ